MIFFSQVCGSLENVVCEWGIWAVLTNSVSIFLYDKLLVLDYLNLGKLIGFGVWILSMLYVEFFICYPFWRNND